jgi:hypothetical protein
MVHNPVTICAVDADGKVRPLQHDGGGNLQVTIASPWDVTEATVDEGESLSSIIDLGDASRIAGFRVRTGWTTADVSFQVNVDDSATGWSNLYDQDGNEVSITGVAAERAYALDPNIFGGFRYLRIRSGDSAEPISQVDAQTIDIFRRHG